MKIRTYWHWCRDKTCVWEKTKKFCRSEGFEKTHIERVGTVWGGEGWKRALIIELVAGQQFLEIRFGGKDGLRYFPNDKVVYHFYFYFFFWSWKSDCGWACARVSLRDACWQKKKSRAEYKVHVCLMLHLSQPLHI